jgi:DNA-binding PadR family transcriptional regulator
MPQYGDVFITLDQKLALLWVADKYSGEGVSPPTLMWLQEQKFITLEQKPGTSKMTAKLTDGGQSLLKLVLNESQGTQS